MAEDPVTRWLSRCARGAAEVTGWRGENGGSVNRASMRSLGGLYPLTAVDGTAAGNTAGAIAASRPGAQPSLPTADEVDAILARA